jgi:predicted SnoaL-like aldol condensation-catalyzing enzyme
LHEHNTAIVRRVVEHIWNGGDLALADCLFAAEYVNHGGLIVDLVHGPEAIKISVALIRTAFPTFHITIERITAEGDTVTLHWTAHNAAPTDRVTNKGTGRGESVIGTTLSSLVAGQIVESWTDWDHVNALQHLAMARPDS